MRYLWLLSCIALTACGPLGTGGPLSGVTERLTSRLSGDAPQDTQDIDPRQALSRELIEAQPNDLILVDVPARGATATLARIGQNGRRVTWIGADGISLTFDRGLLVASRGLGPDLMAADVAGLVAVLRGASTGAYVAETLDGQDQVLRSDFACEVQGRERDPVTIFDRTYPTTKVAVLCRGAGLSFINNYWVDGAGTVWKSEQFVTEALGHIRTERL